MSKVAIIGAGFVGSTCAYALFIEGSANEIALIDINKEKAKGEALDLVHGNLFTPYTKVTYGDSYTLCKNADIVVVTAGAHQKPGDTRLDLTKTNAKILKSIIEGITKYNKNCIILMVTNPLDVLTYLGLKWSKFPTNRVFGTGTTLDTARFRQLLGEYYNVNPTSVHAYILGEHGDSEFPVWSSANIAGIKLKDFKKYDKRKLNQLFKETKNAAYEILNRKGSTYYAIGLVVRDIVRDILQNQHKIYPISCHVDNYYGVKNICLSIPCVLTKKGVKERIHLHLDKNEQKQLRKSASIIKRVIKSVS
ncbi:L-lactate dehydrogenase [archaeon]|jgi:L-lactate dehydrogenase|nr:L-lactate dehydrogenase [archaeon]MBT4022211.1 L-lactate dehydrogenase [archaeon]MBT4272824.1 L-lactate dehydrogenase [archaeon]MBT4461624.1 L-lactate dehydrogenase [archaeon]MBT4857608.1 L-lactate dehydrogenase [archaeon]